jgi:hypothetical protein
MSYAYLLGLDGSPRDDLVLRLDGVLVLTAADDNPDTLAFREWLAAGNVPGDAVPLPISTPRSVAMWRARTIMKVTPWGDGTLFEAVQTAIAGLDEPLQRATAEEALERGDLFDRDGVFVPMLAAVVGISDEQLEDLMHQAAALPA